MRGTMRKALTMFRNHERSSKVNTVNKDPEDFNIPDNPLWDIYVKPITQEELSMIERMWKLSVFTVALLVMMILLPILSEAGTATVNGTASGNLSSLTMDSNGNVVIMTTSGPVTPPLPPQTNVPLLAPADPNMNHGTLKGTQAVSGEKYFRFDVPAQCNRITVAWTTFDWIGKVDMLVKANNMPTLADWTAATSTGYPAMKAGPPIWYNLIAASGDGGETVTMNNVTPGSYYILMKNTKPSASSQFKVWYTPNCAYRPR